MSRRAEKSRVTTCPFADTVANAVIAEFARHQPVLGNPFDGIQTVLAGFVLQRELDGPLEVVAWAVGTKFMSQSLIIADPDGRCVRDSHAEIMARRALQRYLTKAVQANGQTFGKDGQPSVLLTKVGNGGNDLQNGDDVRWRLKAGCGLHFYVSSAPCGNACLKRWAKGQTEKPWTAFADRPLMCPDSQAMPHDKLNITARFQGQVASLVKQDAPAVVPEITQVAVSSAGAPTVASDIHDVAVSNASDVASSAIASSNVNEVAAAQDTTALNTSDTSAGYTNDVTLTTSGGVRRRKVRTADTAADLHAVASNVVRHCDSSGIVAPGTCFAFETIGKTRACSDKLAMWNCLGVQGGRLACILEPIYMSSVIVGRKFSRPHLSRALCCRMQDFSGKHPHAQGSFSVHHPVLLCTAVRFDDGVLTKDGGTLFGCSTTQAWCHGEKLPECIDGPTGVRIMHNSPASQILNSGVISSGGTAIDDVVVAVDDSTTSAGGTVATVADDAVPAAAGSSIAGAGDDDSGTRWCESVDDTDTKVSIFSRHALVQLIGTSVKYQPYIDAKHSILKDHYRFFSPPRAENLKYPGGRLKPSRQRNKNTRPDFVGIDKKDNKNENKNKNPKNKNEVVETNAVEATVEVSVPDMIASCCDQTAKRKKVDDDIKE